jgi:WhiB family redox-sensing transcriptional regulator
VTKALPARTASRRRPSGPPAAKAGVCPAYGNPLAACRNENPNLFFGPDDERGSRKERRIRAAKTVCANCPLALVCARWAVDTRQEFGLWGGLSEDDRRAIWRKQDTPGRNAA